MVKPTGSTTDKLYASFDERLKAVQETTKEIKTMLQQIQVDNAANLERQKQIDYSVTELKKTVFGNGKPGLKTDMQLMKEQMGRVYAIGGIITTAILLDFITRLLLR
mgnify:CR=1 FL=1